jgi:hypothetical protein
MKDLLKFHLFQVKNLLKPKEKTQLIESYVAFIYPLYTHKFSTTSCGAFDKFIWCNLEIT